MERIFSLLEQAELDGLQAELSEVQAAADAANTLVPPARFLTSNALAHLMAADARRTAIRTRIRQIRG
jgi:hypothetical protein